MNREILFRGKRVDNGEWIYGNLTIWNDKSTSIDIMSDEYTPVYAVIPETVGQYTGLTDKNGGKIFEGDVIHVNYSITAPVSYGRGFRVVKHAVDYKAEVVFENYRFCLKKSNGEIYEMHITRGEIEIIGDIHDNPELLVE